MKDTKFTRVAALVMAIAVVFTMLACSGGGKTPSANEPIVATKNNTPDAPQPGNGGASGTKYEIVENVDTLKDDELRYVMIYNPRVYDENSTYDASSLKTGYLGMQVDVNAARADGDETAGYPLSNLPQNFFPPLPEDFEIEQSRADAMGVEYNVGDIATFRTFNLAMDKRPAVQYVCAYEGQYCHIWTRTTASQARLKAVADSFDSKIYKQVTETFGPARFDSSAGGKGKINLIFAPMDNGVYGYSYTYDSFATGEVNSYYDSYLLPNYDHDIVFINEGFLEPSFDSDRTLYSTVAHEFQHLVMAAAAMNTPNTTICRSWINESMSGYIEEVIYPGIQVENERPYSFMTSKLIRKGQSLYNFKTAEGFLSYDVGVYGSVFVFSDYLTDLAGDDVFTKFHKYWRESYSSTLSEAEALVNSVSPAAKAEIDNLVEYPRAIAFADENEEWMSKLALDFYLSMFAKEGNLNAYQPIDNSALLYDEINGATIEGGGRIIVAVDGEFEIPGDADAGLIYIGLDKNFKPVTDFVYK